jgi:hypothetical protein
MLRHERDPLPRLGRLLGRLAERGATGRLRPGGGIQQRESRVVYFALGLLAGDEHFGHRHPQPHVLLQLGVLVPHDDPFQRGATGCDQRQRQPGHVQPASRQWSGSGGAGDESVVRRRLHVGQRLGEPPSRDLRAGLLDVARDGSSPWRTHVAAWRRQGRGEWHQHDRHVQRSGGGCVVVFPATVQHQLSHHPDRHTCSQHPEVHPRPHDGRGR